MPKNTKTFLFSEPNWFNPPSEYRPAPFWSWNAKLDSERLCRQIASMKSAGFGGFFIHSRYGLKTAYLSDSWFECISKCIDKAKALDMKSYLYDEDRWPSGSGGGILTRNDKEHRLKYLNFVKASDASNAEIVAAFQIFYDDEGKLVNFTRMSNVTEIRNDDDVYLFEIQTQEPNALENDGTYIDTLNHQAVEAFIKLTHRKYADRFREEFGGTVPAIFTDEPNYGYWVCGRDRKNRKLWWSKNFREEFAKRRGYDIIDYLPKLLLDNCDGFSKTKYDYFRTLTELFSENFTGQIGSWCDKNNISLTGHLLLEGTLEDQISAVGACMPHYEYMQWPGVDILCDRNDELATVKQCTSVAAQLGKEFVLSELYACTGWDWPLEGHKYIADWQFACGVNFLCPHLSHYSLEGGAKRDYPASIIDHSPWWKYYKNVTDYLSRICYMLSFGKPIRDILVIHPIETAWGLFSISNTQTLDFENIQTSLDDLISGLTKNHWDWDFGDESLLAKYGSIEGDTFVVGQMEYRVVIIPSVRTLRDSTVDLLRKFKENGGKILYYKLPPQFVEGYQNNKTKDIIDKSREFAKVPHLLDSLDRYTEKRFSITENGEELQCVWALFKEVDNIKLLFLQSNDRNNSHYLKITLKNVAAPVIIWDALSGQRKKVKFQEMDNNVFFDLQLQESGSALLTFGLDISDAEQACECKENIIAKQQLSGPFDIQLCELNTLPLDYCRYKFENEPISDYLPTLEVDRQVRNHLGLEPRTGSAQQPWHLQLNGNVDNSIARIKIIYDLNVTEIPDKCLLGIENPAVFQIFINGNQVKAVTGFWIDEDIKTIDIVENLIVGSNQIMLDCIYKADTGLEDLYLLGNFGVSKINVSMPHRFDNITVTKLPHRLQLGTWVGQGLDFYGGSAKYCFTLTLPSLKGRVLLKLPQVSATSVALSVNSKDHFLPWGPFTFDITEAANEGHNKVEIEVIGGRKNILGPLHIPKQSWTGPEEFSPQNPNWVDEYLLTDHGIMEPIEVKVLSSNLKNS